MTEFKDIFDTLLFQLIIPPILYAETHYRFKYFISYLKKKEPEIIADIPSRITVSESIPVLLIIKDADKYPVTIKEVSIIEKNEVLFVEELEKKIDAPYEDIFIQIRSDDFSPGQHYFEIKINYISGNKNRFTDPFLSLSYPHFR